MIFNDLHTSEMPISILSVSFGDVDVPYFNCPCMTRQALTYHPFSGTSFNSRKHKEGLGEMQSLFNVSCFIGDPAPHPDPIPEGWSQLYTLLLSRGSAVTMQFLTTGLPHLLKRVR